jgi:hypothetical protein
LALDFFHSRFGFGRGGDTDGDVPAADPAASSRSLFFPPAAFEVFDGEGFILQVQVSSLAFAQGLRWWFPTAARSDLQSSQQRQRALAVIYGSICQEWLRMHGVKTPKGFGFYL